MCKFNVAKYIYWKSYFKELKFQLACYSISLVSSAYFFVNLACFSSFLFVIFHHYISVKIIFAILKCKKKLKTTYIFNNICLFDLILKFFYFLIQNSILSHIGKVSHIAKLRSVLKQEIILLSLLHSFLSHKKIMSLEIRLIISKINLFSEFCIHLIFRNE